MNIEEVKIDTETIQLDQFLKWAGVLGSCGETKALIAERRIKRNGETESARRRQLHDGDVIEVEDDAALSGVPANELGVEMCPVRMAERGVVDGLDDIRLALGIRAEEDVDARLQRELELRIVPIISQL